MHALLGRNALRALLSPDIRPALRRFFLALITVLLTPGTVSAATAQWYANSGVYPDASCAWTLVDSANGAPALSEGFKLTLATPSFFVDQYVYYEQTNSLTIPDTLRISARLRVVSETHQFGNARRGISIGFTVAPDLGNVLWFDQDSVFLWSGNYGQEGVAARVDTRDAFHTYEITVVNQSAITVHQDGVQILTGSILASPSWPDAPFLYWGDGNGHSSGVSEWAFVVHNANAIACGAPPIPPTLSVNNTSVTEGNAGTVNASFTVSLNHPSDQSVAVGYTTVNGSAIAGEDYELASGVLTFDSATASR